MANIPFQAFSIDDWEVNFNTACIAAISTINQSSFDVCGNFRAYNDYVGLMWNNVNYKNHADFRHEKITDFSGVQLSFDVNFTGAVKRFDAAIEDKAPAISFYYTDGTILSHLLRDSQVGENSYLVDFDNLYERRMEENPDYDPEDPESQPFVLVLFPLPMTNIEIVVMAIIPDFYDPTNVTCTGRSDEFTVLFSNYAVTGGMTTIDDYQREEHYFSIAEGYDDECFRNPKNMLAFDKKLGYKGSINLYIGASHFYDKVGIAGTDSEDFSNFKVVEGDGICLAFRKWLDCLCRYMIDYGFDELVISISMENLHIPLKWQQLFFDKESGEFKPGRTGWSPPTYFYSPTNIEVRTFYERVCVQCIQIAKTYLDASKISLQLGEPWWWWQEFVPGDVTTPYPNRPPCFYDQSTRDLHQTELGRTMPVFYTSSFEQTKDNIETANWLKEKLGEFSDFVKEIAVNNGVKYTVLFFPPSVLDKSRVPKGMQIANYVLDAWKKPALDFLQIEDYDWLMTNNRGHKDVFLFPVGNLGYNLNESNYFAGFAWKEYDHEVEKRAYYRGFETKQMVSGGTPLKMDEKAAYFNIISDNNIYNELQIRSETFTAGDVIYLCNVGNAYLAIAAVNSAWGFTYLSWGMNMKPYQPYIMRCEYNGWGSDPMWETSLVNEFSNDGKVKCLDLELGNNNVKGFPSFVEQWERINKAANKAKTYGFAKTYIWAGTQVRRDGFELKMFMSPIACDDININYNDVK